MFRILLVFLLAVSTSSLAESAERKIFVSGTGSVSVAPDKATVQLGVETQARTAREALTNNSQLMLQVLDVLAREGVSKSDIQTTQISLYPRFENRNSNRAPSVVGYNAQNTVSISVQEISGLGSILDGISEAGGNRIHSISFGLKDRATHLNEARRSAVEDAKQKAALYAEAAGVTLGTIQSISDVPLNIAPGSNFPMARAESMAMDVPISEGELTISSQIHLTFSIVD